MVSDFPASATQPSAATHTLAGQDPVNLSEALAELRLSLEFVLACQAMTRRHLAAAQEKRDRWHQQAKFARHAENRTLSQRACRHDQGSGKAIEKLQAQQKHQSHQLGRLEEQIQALEQKLGLSGSPTSTAGPCSALIPSSIVERFTGQIEL